VNSEVDFAQEKRSLDLAGEQSFATGMRVERLGLPVVAVRLDDFSRNLQLPPRPLEHVGYHRGLGAREFAAA
jgi:hypothetical protein